MLATAPSRVKKRALCKRLDVRQNAIVMGDADELDYSQRELRRFLPLGWSLTDDAEAGWSGDRNAWITTVRDGSGLDWRLSVKLEEARSLGRFEALRMAMMAAIRRL